MQIRPAKHDDGSRRGAAILVSRKMEGKYTVPRKVVHVHEIIVRAGAHRRGLMSYIEGWGRSRGLEAVELNVWANNEDAMAFHRSLGFGLLRYEMHKRLD